jgi:hypothetical protein
MSQILKSLQLSTGSTPATPNSGFGVVYASGSNKFFFENSSGTEVDISTPGRGRINILYYTGSAIGNGTTQTYTWNKPVGLKYIEVCCVGAGGGGGSGRKGTGTAQGGCGGGGGAAVWGFFDANALVSSSYTIVVGAGGAGGLGQTTSATNGNTGITGGTSSFGTLVIARGGGGAPGGAGSVAKKIGGGNAINCTPAGFPYALSGCNGATMPNFPGNPASNAVNIFDVTISNNDIATVTGNPALGNGGGGGGTGGSLGSAIVSGSRGSNGYQFTTLITNGGFPGSASGQSASAPTDNMITTLLQFTGSTTLYGLGGGGHGGAFSSTINAGNGSNGGLYGAGGGGGGALGINTALSSSGNGGSGSSGLCIVTEFF